MKIELGEMLFLDMEIVTEAPALEIFLGPRHRKFEPPTPERLAHTLERLRVEQALAADDKERADGDKAQAELRPPIRGR
jgi:hypothetical protein